MNLLAVLVLQVSPLVDRVSAPSTTPSLKTTPGSSCPSIAFLKASPVPRSISFRRTLSKLNPPRSSLSTPYICADASRARARPDDPTEDSPVLALV